MPGESISARNATGTDCACARFSPGQGNHGLWILPTTRSRAPRRWQEAL
jgi:hypothetical protein